MRHVLQRNGKVIVRCQWSVLEKTTKKNWCIVNVLYELPWKSKHTAVYSVICLFAFCIVALGKHCGITRWLKISVQLSGLRLSWNTNTLHLYRIRQTTWGTRERGRNFGTEMSTCFAKVHKGGVGYVELHLVQNSIKWKRMDELGKSSKHS